MTIGMMWNTGHKAGAAQRPCGINCEGLRPRFGIWLASVALLAMAGTAAAQSPLRYGDRLHIQNGSNGFTGGYLDTGGTACINTFPCVWTNASPTRDSGSGVWTIVPPVPADSTNKKIGDLVVAGDVISLHNEYLHNGGFLDLGTGACYGVVGGCVSTSSSASRNQYGTSRWYITPTGPQVANQVIVTGVPVFFISTSANPNNSFPSPTYLSTSPTKDGGGKVNACTGSLRCVETSANQNPDNLPLAADGTRYGSSAWRFLEEIPEKTLGAGEITQAAAVEDFLWLLPGQNPPQGWVKCGAGTAKSSAICALIIGNQTVSSAMFLGQFVPGGWEVVSGLGIFKGATRPPAELEAAPGVYARLSEWLAKMASTVQSAGGELATVITKIKGDWFNFLTPEREAQLAVALKTSKAGVGVGYGLYTGKTAKIDLGRDAFMVASIVDPTKVSGVISSFMFPELGDILGRVPVPVTPPTVHIQGLEDHTLVSPRGELKVTGWAVGADHVGIILDGRSLGEQRDHNVQMALDWCIQDPALVQTGCNTSGYSFLLSMKSLSKGPHTVNVWAAKQGSPASPMVGRVFVVGEPPPSITLDTPEGTTMPHGSKFTVEGWAVDLESRAQIAYIAVVVDGREEGAARSLVPGGVRSYVAKATYGIARPDVCSPPAYYAFQKRADLCPSPKVGYTVEIDTATLQPGPHKVNVYAVLASSAPPGTPSSVMLGRRFTTRPTVPTVWVDTPADGSTFARGAKIDVAGWAIDEPGAPGVSDVRVFLAEQSIFNGHVSVWRADVCQAYPGRPQCPNVGFALQIDSSTFTPGPHALRVRADSGSGGQSAYVEKKINIK